MIRGVTAAEQVLRLDEKFVTSMKLQFRFLRVCRSAAVQVAR